MKRLPSSRAARAASFLLVALGALPFTPLSASLIAFVATPASAQALAAPAAARSTAPARAPADTMAERVAACVACHGAEGRATTDGFYPRIAGKPEGYLFNQLVNFREGRRDNATMRYLVSNMSDAYLREIAQYFAAQNPPYAPPQAPTATAAVLERGRVLAMQGDAAKNLPACAACHGAALTGRAPAIPGLVGLPRDYLSAQFGAWSNRARRALAPDCMGQIAGRMSIDDLAAVTAWLAAQPVPTNSHALPPAVGERLPLDCGGVPGEGAR